MKPVPQARLSEILTPVFTSFQKDANLEERGHIGYALTNIEEGYEMRTISAFVDDLESVKSCLILKTSNSWMSPAPVAVVLVFWVHPDERKESAPLMSDMMNTAEAFARLNECERIFGSSWVYMGATDISAIWSRHGFDIQEKVFTKGL